MLKYINGGVCAAQGFRAAGIHVGVKTHAAWKKDVALIVSDVDCAGGGHVYHQRGEGGSHPCGPASIWRTARPGPSWPTAATPTPVLPMGEENAERDVRGGGQGHRLPAGGRAGVFHRRYRPDAERPGHRRGHAGAVRGAGPLCGGQRCRGPRHHDHRHREKGSGGGDRHRRQDRPDGRHRQGLRHDPPEYGHDAVLSDH